MAYQRPRDALLAGSAVRVSAGNPIAVYEGPLASGVAICQATKVDGIVQSASGDTLTLVKVKRLSVGGAAAACSSSNVITILAPRDVADVRVRLLSANRTAMLALGMALVVSLLVPVGKEDPVPDPYGF